jgi:hypothetical protein
MPSRLPPSPSIHARFSHPNSCTVLESSAQSSFCSVKRCFNRDKINDSYFMNPPSHVLTSSVRSVSRVRFGPRLVDGGDHDVSES